MELVAINIDHYFFDLELHPKDEFGITIMKRSSARPEAHQPAPRSFLDGETIRTRTTIQDRKRELDAHALKLGKIRSC